MQRRLTLFFLAAALMAPSVALAQDTKTPVDQKNTLSTSPVMDILGFINLEYQRKVSDSTTFGVSAGRFDLDDDAYNNVMVFGRYFPQGAALTGFYFGGRAGVHRITYDESFFNVRADDTRMSIGVDVGYDWLLGRKRNVLIGLGVGANRLLGGDDDFGLNAYPTARLNVGFAF